MRPHHEAPERRRPHAPGLDGASAESLLQMRRALGRQLAALRNRAGLSQWDLAPLTGYSRSTLSDAELGRHRLRRQFWLRCDELLKAEGRLVASYDRVETAGAIMEQRSHGAAARSARTARPLRAVPPAPDHDAAPSSGRHSRIAMETCPHCHRPIAVLVVPSTPPTPSTPSTPSGSA